MFCRLEINFTYESRSNNMNTVETAVLSKKSLTSILFALCLCSGRFLFDFLSFFCFLLSTSTTSLGICFGA